MMNKKHSHFIKPDTENEGKDQLYLDIDRMVNEGLSGGTVFMREDSTNIEESIDIYREEPPIKK